MSRIALVVAMAKNRVIGRDGGLPWHISSELKRFKAITMGKPVIMGRRTWESLPRKPLPGRTNIIVTRDRAFAAEGARTAHDVDGALAIAGAESPEEISVIGGGDIYRQFLPRAGRIYLTEVDITAPGDTHFPPLDAHEWREVSREHHDPAAGDTAGYTLRVLDRVTPSVTAP